jgi:hypothetical protein
MSPCLCGDPYCRKCFPAGPPKFEISTDLFWALEEYLEQRQDVRDGGDGTQLPNEAMSLLMQLREECK